MRFSYYKIVPDDSDWGSREEPVEVGGHADLNGSRIPGEERHWPLLDLDFGATLETTRNGNELMLASPMRKRAEHVPFLHCLTRYGLIENPFLDSDFLLAEDDEVGTLPPVVVLPEVLLYPSTTPGHFHLVFGKPLTWPQYRDLMGCAVDAGVISARYMSMSIMRGQSFLWLQGRKVPCTEMLRKHALQRMQAMIARDLEERMQAQRDEERRRVEEAPRVFTGS